MKSIILKIISTFFLLISLSSFCSLPYQAITIVPVADLLGDAAQNTTSQKKNISTCYNQLPLCSQKTPNLSRLHQLLFNEIVTVLEEKNEEVRIGIPNLFFETAGNSKKHNTYWTLKKNLVSLDTLKKNSIQPTMLPQPIEYEETKINKNQSPATITLLLPFYDEQSHRIFSVGTRFIVKAKNTTNVIVYALNHDASKITTLVIPKKIVLTQNKNQTQEKQIEIFLKLIKLWAHPNQGFIPYVWGGCSYTQNCLQEAFTTTPLNNYQRENYCKNQIKTGFDCTGLLARAAQAAGMPYYFKNSTTILQHLKELTDKNHPENGDIIWLPGHIMIISDAKKNLVIEARSYDHGWGKIHEAPINAIFKNVPTLMNLLTSCVSHKPLERINRAGIVAQEITQCKILSLKSIWQ